MELMIIPESALRFLIAREIVRLQGITSTGLKLTLSARGQSLLTIGGLIGSLYLSYQAIFLLNRGMKLPLRAPIVTRMLIYPLLPLFTVFLQHQIMLAWRRRCCLRADQIVCSLGESFRQGGLEYYNWRLRWNQFWATRYAETKERQELNRKGDKISGFDPVAQYQLEREENSTEKSKAGPDYYLPISENFSLDGSQIIMHNQLNSQSELKHCRIYRFNKSGNELWAGDGDGIGFGLTGILIVGLIPRVLASFFSIFSCPATSRQRYNQLSIIEVN
ncbi:unnamed protein product [Heterobilharzia americana]|nr:unnamed protein product [Heterobilharzia americana]